MIAVVAFFGMPAALILAAIVWCCIPPERHRERKNAPYEHARLSREHRKAWRRFKRASRDVASRSKRIAGMYEEAKR